MKKFAELGIEVIKDLTHKEGDLILKELLYSINEVLYPIQTKYALLELANAALSKLCVIGTIVKSRGCCKRYMAKKEEILRLLRKRCLILQQYIREYNVTEQEEKLAIDITMRYLLSNSIRTKERFINETIKAEEFLKQMEENKKIHHLLSHKIKVYDINIKQFTKVQEEMIAAVAQKYSLVTEE